MAASTTPLQLERCRARYRFYANRSRDRKRRVPGATRCPFDGQVLRYTTDGRGRVVEFCQGCEWRRARRCQDCGRPVQGRSWRCETHKRARRDRDIEAYKLRHHDEVLARQKVRMRRIREEDPARYAHYLAVKKAWRERNVIRIKLQKRKWRLNPDRPNGYSSREKYEAYQRAYRAKHAAHRRELAKRRYYELHPDRPHPVCACGCEQPIPWDGKGRPRKWFPKHDPYPRPLTAKETLMKGVEHAIRVLEKAQAKVHQKLAGVEQLQAELAAIERAINELRPVANGAGVTPIKRPIKRGRGRRAAAAAS